MKIIIKLEEAAMWLLTVVAFYTQLHFSGWVYWAWFLVPDISMLGYLTNTKLGAFFYNLFHHKALAVAVYIAGWYFQSEALQLAGLVLFGHSSFDRMMGYGLKYSDSFSHTHLGTIGKNANNNIQQVL